MSQSAISNRLNSNFGRVKDKELDLHTKLSIQAKQNALPKGILLRSFARVRNLRTEFVGYLWFSFLI